jgi:long-chain acyl-CoA synthetase
MSNLADALTSTAAKYPDRVAIKLDDMELTYALLDEASSRFAGHLVAEGIEPGDRVGMMIPNIPYFPIIYYGILKAGAIVVPMNVLLKGREVRFYVEDPGAKALYAWDGFSEDAVLGTAETDAKLTVVKMGEFEALLSEAEPIAEVVQRDEYDTAVLLYTSGTTGTPKGAELTHKNLAWDRDTLLSMFAFTPDDVLFGGLPLFHSYGQTCCMNTAIAIGASLSLLPRFDPGKALEMIERDKITIFQGVPTMYIAMLNDPKAESVDTSSLSFGSSGGASLPLEVLNAVRERFGIQLLEGYGLSETAPSATTNTLDPPPKVGSIGRPLTGVSMKIVDDDGNEVPTGEVGEVIIQGPNVMKGYWNRPEATAEVMKDGWFYSGDIGKVDEEGYFFIVDRKKEMIIRGGYNVYPREIEEVLYEHPAILEVAVLGVPDDTLGEEVAAAIAFKPGQSATVEDIQAFAKERMAAYKYPRHIWFADELPKTATGKILKREIAIPAALRPADITA